MAQRTAASVVAAIRGLTVSTAASRPTFTGATPSARHKGRVFSMNTTLSSSDGPGTMALSVMARNLW